MRRHRHPALETAVFAAALLLSAFIARELWRRRPIVSSPMERGKRLTQPYGEDMPLPKSFGQATPSHRTEQAVSGVAPIKLTRVQRRKPKAVPVPK